ncbi:MAG: hypothetical protein KDD15_11210, partial [Lewinella sp.]|nr:hypothetical protein [Lewinella sp.]
VVTFLLVLYFFLTNRETAISPNKVPEPQDAGIIYRRPVAYENPDNSRNPAIQIIGGDSQSPDSDQGRAVCWLSSGDIAFASTYDGQGTLDTFLFSSRGKRDILLGTYRPEDGNINWLLPFGGDVRDMPRAIATDSKNNIILTGDFGSALNFKDGPSYRAKAKDNAGLHEFFVAKFDATGKIQWLDHAGGNSVSYKQTGFNAGTAIAVDRNDDIIVAGTYIGAPEYGGETLPVGGPNEDTFIAKYSEKGLLKWVKTMTGEYQIVPHAIDTDAQGNIFVCGSFGHHNYSGEAYIGRDTFKSYGGRDIFLAKYDPEGVLLWVKQAGSAQNNNGYDAANGLSIDKDGNCYITGFFVGEATFDEEKISSRGGRDIFLAKYNSAGTIIWVQRAGGSQGNGPMPEGANSICTTPEGNIILTGDFAGTAYFGSDSLVAGNHSNFFVASYDSSGLVTWLRQFSIEGLDDFQKADGFDVDVNASGQIVVTGYFLGSIMIDSKIYSSQGNGDIFILVFDKEGVLLSAGRTVQFS